ncbi:MAG: acyltransferase [Nitrospiraceae bacterium]|nr:acyltransferase [Nitrospiraceae bacterium]
MLLKRIKDRWISRMAIKLGVMLQGCGGEIANASLPEFGNKPKKLVIELPRRISNPQLMTLGDNIWIGPGSLLMALKRYPTPPMMPPDDAAIRQRFKPRINIGNRVTSTGNLQISAMQEITVEEDVMFASNVLLTDGMHGHVTANIPYKFQDMSRIAPIVIGKGSWIGQNVVIMPGVIIGECAIVGANSIVTSSIPGRCIAVGAPAKVIKKWDEEKGNWVAVS